MPVTLPVCRAVHIPIYVTVRVFSEPNLSNLSSDLGLGPWHVRKITGEISTLHLHFIYFPTLYFTPPPHCKSRKLNSRLMVWGEVCGQLLGWLSDSSRHTCITARFLAARCPAWSLLYKSCEGPAGVTSLQLLPPSQCLSSKLKRWRFVRLSRSWPSPCGLYLGLRSCGLRHRAVRWDHQSQGDLSIRGESWLHSVYKQTPAILLSILLEVWPTRMQPFW